MNIELLKRAYEIIEAIPDNVINLDYIHRRIDCGAICCAAGWLAQEPEFKVLGLSLPVAEVNDGFVGGSLAYNGREVSYSSALARVFDATWGESVGLFCPRGDVDKDEDNFPGTDKELWLRRVRDYLADCKAEADALAKALED